MTKLLFPFSLFTLAAAAGSLQVGYSDGTQVAIQTTSTGIDVQQVIYSDGVFAAAQDDVWHRVVSDKQKKVLFAYDLEAGRGPSPGTFFIRIKPIGAAYAHELQPTPVPTVAAVREFASIKAGQSVALETLSNPAGERIFDVLQPFLRNSPGQSSGEELAFNRIAVSINGHAIPELADIGMTGAGALLYLPQRGAYFLSLDARTGFQQVAHVEGDKLWFDLDYDHIEIVSQSHLLPKAGNRLVWVKHDRSYRPDRSSTIEEVDRQITALGREISALRRQYADSHPMVRQLQSQLQALEEQKARSPQQTQSGANSAPFMATADNIDWLIPKK